MPLYIPFIICLPISQKICSLQKFQNTSRLNLKVNVKLLSTKKRTFFYFVDHTARDFFCTNLDRYLEDKRKTECNYEFFLQFVNTTNFAKYLNQSREKIQEELRRKQTPVTPRSRQIEVETGIEIFQK